MHPTYISQAALKCRLFPFISPLFQFCIDNWQKQRDLKLLGPAADPRSMRVLWRMLRYVDRRSFSVWRMRQAYFQAERIFVRFSTRPLAVATTLVVHNFCAETASNHFCKNHPGAWASNGLLGTLAHWLRSSSAEPPPVLSSSFPPIFRLDLVPDRYPCPGPRIPSPTHFLGS